jgi:hypothetical protein
MRNHNRRALRLTQAVACCIAPMALGIAGCGSPPQPAEPAYGTMSSVIVVPAPPPAPQAELVPPPPTSAPTVWQPGHWQYTGIATSPWQWESGHYMEPLYGRTAWIPGRWVQQGAGWVWVEGHWA